MFEIAPHGKTIIAAMPYGKGGASLHLTLKEGRYAALRLRELSERFWSEEDAEEDPPLDCEREPGGASLSCRFAPHVLEGGESCRVYLSLGAARRLATMLALACPPEVRRRTRTNAAAHPVRVRKRRHP